MTAQEVKAYADQITHINNRSEIRFKSGHTIEGYFNDNHDENLKNNNQWNFVVLPQEKPELKVTTLFNGDEFESIDIYKY